LVLRRRRLGARSAARDFQFGSLRPPNTRQWVRLLVLGRGTRLQEGLPRPATEGRWFWDAAHAAGGVRRGPLRVRRRTEVPMTCGPGPRPRPGLRRTDQPVLRWRGRRPPGSRYGTRRPRARM